MKTHLAHDILIVVVAEGATQLVVIHIGLRFTLTPSSRHVVGVD